MKFHLRHTSDVSSFLTQQTSYLFNHGKHLLLQAKNGWSVFEFHDGKTGTIYARIAFNIKADEALSPLRAPFGSVEVYKRMTEAQLMDFFQKVLAELINRGVKKVDIRHFPHLYDELLSHRVKAIMKRLHFAINNEISSVIQVDEKPFEKKIRISERQKLKKARLNFELQMTDRTDFTTIYGFIARCRKERNQSLSMTMLELKKTISAFPDSFYFFKVVKQDEIAAAAIVIRVSKEILYTFYYAHAKKYNPVSPVVYLISGIYDFAKNNKCKLLDLGTSMLNGHVNQSLLYFKKSIGGISTEKLTYIRSL